MKYSTEAICPIMMNGCSTGCPPIQVRMMMSDTKSQNRAWEMGRKALPRCFDTCKSGTRSRIMIENSSASTPPSLLGMERKMA